MAAEAPYAAGPVVAAAGPPSPHPFAALALSPGRTFACGAARDALHLFRVGPDGLAPVRVLPVAHHFQATAGAATPAAAVAGAAGTGGGGPRAAPDAAPPPSRILDAFLGPAAKPPAGAAAPGNVAVTSVAWSRRQLDDGAPVGGDSERAAADVGGATFLAVAGSNGVVVVFCAESLLSADASPVVEAVLAEHVRAVNGLAWHPTRPGLLLSASQDGTVLLWERQWRQDDPVSSQANKTGPRFNFFGGPKVVPTSTYVWSCRSRFEPKSEAVRDIQWSPFYEDVFGLVTASGSFIAYNRHVTIRALVKLTAHSGDATTLDWHPTRRHVIATGGANDRSVKVWDLEDFLNIMERTTYDVNDKSLNTYSMVSRTDSINSNDDSSSEPAANVTIDRSQVSAMVLASAQSGQSWSMKPYSPLSTANTYSMNNSSRHGGGGRGSVSSGPKQKALLHVLSVSASVTRVRWRPPAAPSVDLEDAPEAPIDLHETMMAVATVPVKGASAGGRGVLALWTHDRPFVPLRVVQGHVEGSVTDFEWLETPQQQSSGKELTSSKRDTAPSTPSRVLRGSTGRNRRGQTEGSETSLTLAVGSKVYGPSSSNEVDAILFENTDKLDEPKFSRIWQHVLSVGRDGRCLIQSFVRGDNPLSRVPPSCFALANLSPFQKGYGSLQIFSVSQKLPTDSDNAFLLTGLRSDGVTNVAPGIFREPIRESTDHLALELIHPRKKFPAKPPDLVFNVVDRGDLDDDSKPIKEHKLVITVAPEVVHLSRLASRYVLYPNEQLRSGVDLCLHNCRVAASLDCGNLAHMWHMVAAMLESCGHDNLLEMDIDSNSFMNFVIFPTLKSLLEERAEDGDVQTCVALCELLQVIKADSTIRIPGLDINLVREWYLSYIDLLKDMCLFSHASSLIRCCNDAFIGALNQQSTTLHEACPSCGKPLHVNDGVFADDDNNARRTCRSCRKRVGMCFLCHEPVKGMFVWCPGCGHGGHLDHALQWFGGLHGKAVREVCPTGCGHKCNLIQQISAFPRTSSMKEISWNHDLEPISSMNDKQ